MTKQASIIKTNHTPLRGEGGTIPTIVERSLSPPFSEGLGELRVRRLARDCQHEVVRPRQQEEQRNKRLHGQVAGRRHGAPPSQTSIEPSTGLQGFAY